MNAVVLSRSCTTGWADWSPGELILTSTAVIRLRLPPPPTGGSRPVGAVPDDLAPHWAPTLSDAPAVRAAHPTNRFIALQDVATARLHRGLLSDRLLLILHDGTRHKLLWLHRVPAWRVLREQLPVVAPGILQLD